jgi:phosphate-selective porin OprO/OprP
MKPIRIPTCAFLAAALTLPVFAGGEPAGGAGGSAEDGEAAFSTEFNLDRGLAAAIAAADVQVQFGGQMMYDIGFSSPDRDLVTPAPMQSAFPLADGSEFRRARIYAKGTLFEAVEFKAEYDFAGGDADFKDIYMQVDAGFAKVRAGHYKEPFGLEENTSSKYITFNERSLTGTFTPVRNSGLMLHDAIDGDVPFSWAAGVFRTTDDYGDDKSSDSGEYNVTARATVAPLYDKDAGKVLHFGLATSVRSDISHTNRFRSRPENHLAPELVDTRAGGMADFPSDGYVLSGAEVAWTRGPLSLQGEYMQANVNGTQGGGNPTFWGYYGMLSYFLTGEHRPYKHGVFQRVKPKGNLGQGGKGALELTGRYSAVDLNDGNAQGGELDDITVGVNWYLNPNARVMFNFVHSELDDSAVTRDGNGTLESFLIRFQFDF